MRERAFRVMITAALAVATACGDNGNTNCEGSNCADDGGGGDVVLTCADPGGPVCDETQLCLGGMCVNNSCATANPCGTDDRCALTCVPTMDLCTGVMCGDMETCVNGQCVAGCFGPSACLNKDCPDDEFCYFGACLPLLPCDAPCGAGYMCQIACRPPDPCENTTCEPNQFCVAADGEAQCIDNPCFGVTCPAGQACNGGSCVTTCDCPGGCGANGTCVTNTCQCVPECSGKACGDDDGCGDECDVACPQGGNYDCRGPADNLTCQCVPNCTGKACGDDNGCGADCTTACTDTGEACGGSGTNLTCACPVNRPECSGDCCPNQSDTCETMSQTGIGVGTPTTNPEACCTAAKGCTDPSRADVCCTGNGLTCLDNGTGDARTESCCTVGRQTNDNVAPVTSDVCCDANNTAMDTNDMGDIDALKDTCCPNNRACTEISTCCGTNEVCSTAPGAANDRCCPIGSVNCDGKCVPACANGQTQFLCGDGIQDNEVCCGNGLDRCPNAPNATSSPNFCCGAVEDRCYPAGAVGAGNAPICCSDPESYCDDSGACCPNAETCLADKDAIDANDTCCTLGQVLDDNDQCCTPTCPDPSTVTCGTLDSCGYQECPGTCNAVSTCIENSEPGAPDYACQPVACNPVCNTAGCYDCIGGSCDYRCDNPGQGGSCIGGQCVTL